MAIKWGWNPWALSRSVTFLNKHPKVDCFQPGAKCLQQLQCGDPITPSSSNNIHDVSIYMNLTLLRIVL